MDLLSFSHRSFTPLPLPLPLPHRTPPATSSRPSSLLPFPHRYLSKPVWVRGARAFGSDEMPSPSAFVAEKLEVGPTDDDTVAVVEKVEVEEEKESPDEPVLSSGNSSDDFLNNFDVKLDSDTSYSILLYGTGALVALWLSSAVVGALDSIPVIPKVMEVVGLGFTVWFSYRYLIFKENREELLVKIEDLKQQVIGSADD